VGILRLQALNQSIGRARGSISVTQPGFTSDGLQKLAGTQIRQNCVRERPRNRERVDHFDLSPVPAPLPSQPQQHGQVVVRFNDGPEKFLQVSRQRVE
jgi:hypothetical protein